MTSPPPPPPSPSRPPPPLPPVPLLGAGGLDYGGLAREFFYHISGEVFDPRLGMFEYCASDDKLQISPDSASSDDHLLFFRFVGRLLGMAIFHNHFLDVVFTKSFYKHLLGEPLTLQCVPNCDFVWSMHPL